LRSYLEERVEAPIKKTEITAIGICNTYHVTPLYPLKLAVTSPSNDGYSISTVRLRTKATELLLLLLLFIDDIKHRMRTDKKST
jgi:hypothetical protein